MACDSTTDIFADDELESASNEETWSAGPADDGFAHSLESTGKPLRK